MDAQPETNMPLQLRRLGHNYSSFLRGMEGVGGGGAHNFQNFMVLTHHFHTEEWDRLLKVMSSI